MNNYIYIARCEYHPSLYKVFNDEDSAIDYVDFENKQWESAIAWYYYKEQLYKK